MARNPASLLALQTVSAFAAQPFTHAFGRSRATRRASPACSVASATRSTSLYAPGASSATPRIERVRIRMPFAASSWISGGPAIRRSAWWRLIARPAPWHAEAKRAVPLLRRSGEDHRNRCPCCRRSAPAVHGA